MANYDEAMDAIKGLDNTEFQGIKKQTQRGTRGGGLSTSAWQRRLLSPRYPGERPEPPTEQHVRLCPPPPPPPPPPPRRALILRVATASETATGWLITMRNTEPALTALRATMIGVPSPLLLLPRHWLENVLEWGHLTV
ncbi:hypothetical protein INR49_028077 [Caranx melampygus]|nr:hypothetical protein INR49_028077 [Caranx melampygus]